MELEPKHLSPYLPYGLKIATRDMKAYFLIGIETETPSTQERVIYKTEKRLFLKTYFYQVKPILRPLSDLMSIQGYHFIYDQETDINTISNWIDLDIDCRLTDKYSYEFWQLLFENHFDVFGLIEKGLAIDKNTIN